MNTLLSQVIPAYIKKQDLLQLLKNHTADPESWISEMIKQEELLLLKEDFFGIVEKLQNSPDPQEQIANHLYGPSYVSFEWALAYYRMIPEGVFVVTSATTNESTHFETPLGWFYYYFLKPNQYAVGIDHKDNSIGGFLMATPEKALADLVYYKSDDLDADELLDDLIEGRRIDDTDLKRLNKNHMKEIAHAYQSPAVTNLMLVLDKLS